MISGVFRNIER